MRKGTHHSQETKKVLSEQTKRTWVIDKTFRAKALANCFKKGQEAWNKGIKGQHMSPETEFKEGELVGDIHPSWKGGTQKPKNDCAYLWSGANKRIRRPKAVWEARYGKLPVGYIIYHIDGDKDNDEITNLIPITRADLIRINQKNRKV